MTPLTHARRRQGRGAPTDEKGCGVNSENPKSDNVAQHSRCKAAAQIQPELARHPHMQLRPINSAHVQHTSCERNAQRKTTPLSSVWHRGTEGGAFDLPPGACVILPRAFSPYRMGRSSRPNKHRSRYLARRSNALPVCRSTRPDNLAAAPFPDPSFASPLSLTHIRFVHGTECLLECNHYLTRVSAPHMFEGNARNPYTTEEM